MECSQKDETLKSYLNSQPATEKTFLVLHVTLCDTFMKFLVKMLTFNGLVSFLWPQ